MRKTPYLIVATSLGIGLVIAPQAPAHANVTKPSEPTVALVVSSTPKKGKVNVTVTITLPTSDGGSKITGSKVTAGGKSCTMKKLKTSCTIKGLKSGKTLSVSARSKNKKGFGAKSASVSHVTGNAAVDPAAEANLYAAVNFYASSLMCHAGGLAYHYASTTGCALNKTLVGGASSPGLPWPPPDWATTTKSFQANSISLVNLSNLNSLLASDPTGELKVVFENAVSQGQSQGTFIFKVQDTQWWLTKGSAERKRIVMAAYNIGSDYWPYQPGLG